MDRHVEAFLEMLAAERGAARNTLLAYRRRSRRFRRVCGGAGAAAGRRRCAALRGYMARAERGRAVGADGGAAAVGLRQFHRFLAREGVRGDDPTALLERRGCRSRCRNTWRRRRWTRCWRRPGRGRRRSGWRWRRSRSSTRPACGCPSCWRCRAAALAGDAALLLVRGKGGRERLVPLSEPAREAAAALVAAQTPAGAGTCSPAAIRAGR